MQLMAENMKGIMQIIAHRMDTSGKKGFPVDRKEVERGEKSCSVRDNICIVRREIKSCSGRKREIDRQFTVTYGGYKIAVA